jgi:hypothetical protein
MAASGFTGNRGNLSIADRRSADGVATLKKLASAPMWCAALALPLLVMLPRLASPQFGLLDDGFTLRAGRQVIGDWSTVFHLIPDTGRFFPAYWLTRAAVLGTVGARPLALFLVNLVLLTVVLGLLGRLVTVGGGGTMHVGVALIVLALTGPTIEGFYTLSKAEPLQLVWIGLSLLAALAAVRSAGPLAHTALAALGAAALLLGHATKETSLVMVAISLGWLALAVLGPGRQLASLAAAYLLISVVAAMAFAGLRWVYAPVPLSQGWYTRAYAADLSTMGPALFRIAVWLVRDFVFLLPLLALAGWALIDGRGASRRLVPGAGVWMAGWLAVYVPWPATFEYHLLPFAFGAAALGGAVVGDTWQRLASERSRVRRRVAWSALAATALLWAVTVVNAIADARVQLAVDRANAELVEFLAGVPAHSRIVVNVAHENEYVYELPLHLAELKQRGDVTVSHGASAVADPAPPGPVFVVTPEMAHPPVPTVRIAPHEPAVVDVVTTRGPFHERAALVYRNHQQTAVLELGIHRLLCRLSAPPIMDATYCPRGRGVSYWQTFSYGWQVHRLESTKEPDA